VLEDAPGEGEGAPALGAQAGLEVDEVTAAKPRGRLQARARVARRPTPAGPVVEGDEPLRVGEGLVESLARVPRAARRHVADPGEEPLARLLPREAVEDGVVDQDARRVVAGSGRGTVQAEVAGNLADLGRHGTLLVREPAVAAGG